MELQKIRQFNYIISEIDEIYHDTAVRLGVSDSVQRILYVVYEGGGSCRQSEIYKQTGISRQTINSSIRGLEKKGVVYLEQGLGRNTIVCLTERGKTFADRMVRPIMEAENEIFEEWTKEEVDLYLSLTERYKNALKEKLSRIDTDRGTA